MFKTLFLLAALAAGAWWYLHHTPEGQKVEKKAEKVDNTATQYVSNLQNDVKKAEDAAQKANAAIKQETDAVGKTLKDAEGNR
jgi:hypothetical protein